jgi:hypothetical protein
VTEVEDVAFWGLCALIAGLVVFLVLAICGVIPTPHAHEHCIRQDYVSEGKAGYQWECVKWAKL